VTFENITGKFVICSDGFDLGEINGVEIDSSTWQVTHLRIKLSKAASEDFGLKKRFSTSTICLPTSLVAKVGDNVLLNKSFDELAKHPEIRECRDYS
jgi:sporulation protein YlmC with PRC-barrel domain